MAHCLQKGENISLAQIDDFVIVTEWKAKLGLSPIDINASAFLLTEQNKVTGDRDFIFHNQPRSFANAILLKENRFKVSLNQLTSDISRIAFVLSIHEAHHRKHNFSLVNGIRIKVFDFATRQEITSYQVDDANNETAIILATMYRRQNAWKFKAIGQGYEKGLAVLAKNFGVDIEPEVKPALSYNEQWLKQQSIIADNTKNSHLSTSTQKPQKSTLKLTLAPKLPTKESRVKTKNLVKNELPNPVKALEKNKSLKSKQNPKQNSAPLANTVNIHDTDALTLKSQYEPITHWFKHKSIAVEINPEAMDTSGFFDEVAVALGDNYELLKIVSNKIKHRQLSGKDKAYIELANHDDKDIEIIKQFCKELYDYSFVAKYFYNTHKKLIALNLQSATRIIQFFNGEWLEWYVFMKIVDYCHSRQLAFSCTRNMRIEAINGRYEIDVFFLINGTPLFIECKSGEYRQYIDKYCKLRKQLVIDKPYFLFLIADMNEIKTKGLTAMFDITFLNVQQLTDYIAKIV